MSEVSWTRERIGAVLKVRYGKALPKDQRDDSAPFPVLGSAGRMTGTAEPLAFDPVVIIGRKGNVGQVQLETAGCWPIDTTYYAAIPERLDERFLTWQLRSLPLGKLDSSTATPSLRREDLEAQEILVPPLEEQRRIVAILEDHLSHLDAADSQLDAAAMRISALSAHVLAHALADATCDEVPLTSLLGRDLANGRSVKTCEGGFPVLRLSALTDGMVDLRERKPGAWTADEAERFLVHQGDFLISRGNGSLHLVGRGGLVAEDPDPVAFPDTLIRARPRADLVDAGFLALVWNSTSVRRQIEQVARTTAGIYKVNQRDLGRVVVPVPSLPDQRRILAEVAAGREALGRLTQATGAARERSGALRRSLLAAAFSGRLTGSSSDMSVVEGRVEA
ncbi:restriction endonuclease subunit S [Pseudactinotalea sp. HY158]|uniref:restriction endonuclease subunit S n=1 Tax=unclassified Pseudactinotalea TaxID=2649176 RepID=UPI00128D08F5|nr:restriction endonuclease subunit S [Pseudactinotalea sp. HY158]MPV49227.1 hypothetical protein [Pseudactinotalea sp. HY160]QGH68100.1 hypothetical protein GCE65_00075 [Pseudactinotalea sp. HY158]